ncbi:patatin-like phospholipase family protein [Afifella sp. IM 167]|uniref:patatin-like phospholipase family protein n=1 Tax=Afifella sp. IM 167 TaxID=2033586 RepID=UPI001CCC3E2F|nr:patatin-like phospholipase family protein [Afifella sp. IM 167]MBZ8133471.1 patatin [Afifella sp. IM 167]
MSVDHNIGLVLGGGGARGMAHILVCEVFDELGVKPAQIAGTSIGAIIGLGYASGMSGREMREASLEFFAQKREIYSRLWQARPIGVGDIFRGRLLQAQFDPLRVLDMFVPGIERTPETFEELAIPLKVVSCDFYGWCETIMDHGPIRPAVAASIAIPSVFKPVLINGRLQIDGGAVNPLPIDLCLEQDLIIASDVAGGPTGDADKTPGLLETIIGTAQISMQAVQAEKLKRRKPDILFRPAINDFFVLDFLKTDQILAMNEPLKDDLKRRMEHMVDSPFEREPMRIGVPMPEISLAH